MDGENSGGYRGSSNGQDVSPIEGQSLDGELLPWKQPRHAAGGHNK